MSCHSDDFSLSSFSGPDSDVSVHDANPSYYPLQSVFVRALAKWKQQSVSFVSLPPEVRNRIYRLACERSHTNDDLPVRFDAFHRCMFPCCERGGLMYSCKQVRREFMPLFIASIFFLLHLGYREGTTGFELVTWLKEAGPVLTSHVRRLQVNFGVNWSDNSRTVFAPLDFKLTTPVYGIAVLRIDVSQEGDLEISQMYDTKFDERVLPDIQDKVGRSFKVGSTGLMGFDEFKIVYEVLQQYRPGFNYAVRQGY
ncbi:hypothetical protein KCU64_g21218, partial [Aureobasidium melanogenum]